MAVATELAPSEFAAAIGVKSDDLAALERAGLPFVNRKRHGHVYPLPAAIKWYVEHAIATRVGGIPPRTTQKELAALVGYTPRTLSNLVEEGKLTTVVENGRRLYPLPDCVHQIIEHRESQARGKTGEKMTPLDEAKLRKLEADAQAAELTLMERRGELLARPLVERALADLMQGLKAQLVQFAPRYEADLIGLDTRVKVRAVLKPAMHAELLRLGAAGAQVGRRIQMIDATVERDEDDESNATDTEEPDARRHAS